MFSGFPGSRVGHRGSSVVAAVSWVVSGTADPIIQKSKNVRRIQRIIGGVWRVHFDQPLPDAKYSVLAGGRWSDTVSNDMPIVGPNRNGISQVSPNENYYTPILLSIMAQAKSGSLFDVLYAYVVCYYPDRMM